MQSEESTSWTRLGYSFNVLAWLSLILLMLSCFYIFLHQRRSKRLLRQTEFRKQVDIARQCMMAAHLSSIEIATLAVEAGMMAHDVYREYFNDVVIRREIVECILGSAADYDEAGPDAHNMAKKMMDKFPSRFLSHGYAQQRKFIEALPVEERHRPNPATSIRLPPTVPVPAPCEAVAAVPVNATATAMTTSKRDSSKKSTKSKKK